MQMDCPYGYERVMRLSKNVVMRDSTVNVCGGVCDSAEFCNRPHCLFYDLTKQGTRHFQKASGQEHTLDGLQERQRQKVQPPGLIN